MRNLVWALALIGSCSAYGDVLYGLSSAIPSGTVYAIDTATGAATPVVTLTGDVLTGFVDITFLNGTAYASDVNLPGAVDFGTIDLSTGAFTPLSQQGGSSNWQGLAANPTLGVIYSAAEDGEPVPLQSVTPSGTITFIGNTTTQINDLAYDSVHGILYAIDDSSDSLYTVNTTTGAATLVGATGFASFVKVGLGYDSNNNTLYANNSSNHNLYSLNTATGTATLIGPNGTTATIDGLADFAELTSVPEPATSGLIGLGLAALVWNRWRRTGRSRTVSR